MCAIHIFQMTRIMRSIFKAFCNCFASLSRFETLEICTAHYIYRDRCKNSIYTFRRRKKVNTLCATFSDLQILFVDEISMVNHNLLVYIHGRRLKQTGDHSLFGNISVIAVGDFFQLSPVKGKPLYLSNTPVDLWNGNFSVTELTDIVRQQDTNFD